jgi:hypothetical protein
MSLLVIGAAIVAIPLLAYSIIGGIVDSDDRDDVEDTVGYSMERLQSSVTTLFTVARATFVGAFGIGLAITGELGTFLGEIGALVSDAPFAILSAALTYLGYSTIGVGGIELSAGQWLLIAGAAIALAAFLKNADVSGV